MEQIEDDPDEKGGNYVKKRSGGRHSKQQINRPQGTNPFVGGNPGPNSIGPFGASFINKSASKEVSKESSPSLAANVQKKIMTR